MAGWHRYGNDMILQHTTAELNTWMLTQRQIQKNADWTKVTNIVTPLHLKSAPISSITLRLVSLTVKIITWLVTASGFVKESSQAGLTMIFFS